jgi:uncharacterized protein (DUF736 family)
MPYDNTNSGAAFRKDNANPNAPKWSGPINVNGKEYEISIWEKTSKAGKEFLSLKIGEPYKKKGFDQHNKDKGNGYAPKDRDEDGDLIPF